MPATHVTGVRFAFYSIYPHGDLHWYRHDGWTQGTAHWTAGAGGNKISGGWNIYNEVFSGSEGVIYAIKPNGDLHWYRHDG
ncbi:tachylectin-related carbohydrate-binding protein, partial [Streptomyces sp. M41]|uniref:tachylectin-related carbohydrate-binding protein n=1 Tax=Streptomyces sp. M41 TaxID=3059412 RepID=UPI00374D935D